MCGTVPGSIISIEMIGPENTHARAAQESDTVNPPSSDAVTLAVCGDPVVGRGLELLLRDFNYEVMFLPVSSSSDPEVLQGVRLIVLTLTPELSGVRREALVKSLGDATRSARIPILELVVSSDVRREDEASVQDLEHVVPWPCSTEELRRRIEAALLHEHGADHES